MVESMVERVARAIAVSHYPDKEADVMWRHMVPDARAAIGAMREPTDAMVDAALSATGFYEDGSNDYLVYYTSMIDAALNEQVSG